MTDKKEEINPEEYKNKLNIKREELEYLKKQLGEKHSMGIEKAMGIKNDPDL